MRYNPKNIFSAAAIILCVTCFMLAQEESPKSTTLSELKNSPRPAAPNAADVMRNRISMAKAYLVVKNYPAAIYELENIKRETNDPTVHRVLNVLLMHAYLEQGEYVKAQKFLKELDADASKSDDYFAVAGQVISGARSQLSRYQALGIPVTDRSLPDEATKDLDGMRETLELVSAQSREKGKKKELSATAAAIFEESSAARGNLGRDAYDERVWKDQVAEAREQIVNPRTKIIDVTQSPVAPPEVTLVAKAAEEDDVPVDTDLETIDKKVNSNQMSGPELKPVGSDSQAEKIAVPKTIKSDKVAANKPGVASPTDRKVIVIGSAEKKPVDENEDSNAEPEVKSTDQDVEEGSAESRKGDDRKKEVDSSKSPVPMGSLITYATRRVNPVYPVQAKSMRMEGTVKVDVIVDEDGKVSKVESTSGPALLKRAAREAVRKWQFKPFLQDGQPVKATGYVSFNFNL